MNNSNSNALSQWEMKQKIGISSIKIMDGEDLCLYLI